MPPIKIIWVYFMVYLAAMTTVAFPLNQTSGKDKGDFSHLDVD